MNNARQDSYVVADMMARFKLNSQTDIAINVDNVFDEHYRTQPDRMSFGSPRTVTLPVRHQF